MAQFWAGVQGDLSMVKTYSMAFTTAKGRGASTSGKGTFHLGEQRKIRRACASAQSRQNLRCPHNLHTELKEASDKEQHLSPCWVTERGRSHVLAYPTGISVNPTGARKYASFDVITSDFDVTFCQTFRRQRRKQRNRTDHVLTSNVDISKLFRNWFLTLIGWWSQWAELKFHEALHAFCRISSDERQKSNDNFYIYTLYLDHFCVLIVMIRC